MVLFEGMKLGSDKILIDFLQDLVRYFHGPEPIDLIYDRLRVVSDGACKFLELFFDRVYIRHFRAGNGDGLSTTRGLDIERKNIFISFFFQLDHFRFLLEEINPDISIFLEETDLAHFFHGDAAGGKISHTANVEFDPDVRYIRCVGHDGHATRGNMFHFTFHKAENNINIVDHQVKDHADFRSSWIKLGEAVHLNEH